MSTRPTYTRSRRATAVLLAMISVPLAAVPAAAQTGTTGSLTISGDLRTGYYASQRTDRDGAESEKDDWRARLRVGAALPINDKLSIRLRAAGRFSTEQESMDFVLQGHAPTVDGLEFGQATLDEAYLHFQPSGLISLRAGRFQSKFVLADLLGKSLDRGDSPNTDISWTDGLHLTLGGLPGSWNTHLILQHNSTDGPSNVVRAPLVVGDSRSRITYFAALENTVRWGPVVQRSIDLTYIPGALHVDGITPGSAVEDYVAVVARGALAWPVAAGRLLVGGEAGFAPNTPSRAALRIGEPGSGRSGGTAYQVGVTLADLIANHRIGVIYSEAEAGWLIAPDCRNNDSLIELRYQWQFARSHSFEARLRDREDLEMLTIADQRRHDVDIYLRITSRF